MIARNKNCGLESISLGQFGGNAMNIDKELIFQYLINSGGIIKWGKRGLYVFYKKKNYWFDPDILCVDGYRIYKYDFFKFILMIHGKKPFSYNNRGNEVGFYDRRRKGIK